MGIRNIFATGICAATTVVLASLASGPLQADEFPERRIQHYYPWNASGTTFAASQIIAEAMGEELGEKMVVLSKPGASGQNAFKAAMNEPADGYTTIDGYQAPLIMGPLNGDAGYTFRDFTPLHFSHSFSMALVSRADETRWSDLTSFIEYVKAHPGETRYSGGPEVAMPHMVGAKLMQHSDSVSRHVPYAEANDAVKDLRSGILDWMVVTPGIYKANESKLRVEVVLSDNPASSEWYNGAKTIKDYGIDFGLTGIGSLGWTWWLVAKDTPDNVVAVLRDAQAKALNRPDVRKKVSELGFVLNGYTADQYEDVVSSAEEQVKTAVAALSWEKSKIQELNK
ncbi:MFS transporter [Marinobacterium nitratireducens]|uniref:MFS transporter n=1 Tax=Marinobacterium nitratireducens TaxID=518897 RepID=A0A917ZIQ8_9GAMM|nr:tripartite tricarboxylate transporter substrate-binding protein [Marinobacterium nitratireducens]GGO83845.1 MFS transporter [Marinobacterium nitratireducens]